MLYLRFFLSAAPIQYTATKTGCACSFDTTRTDCACCVTGGTHCGQVYPNECYYSSSSECGSDENEVIDGKSSNC